MINLKLFQPNIGGRRESLLRSIFLAQSCYLGDSTSITFVENGCRMYVDTNSVDIGSHLLTLGTWESDYTKAFIRMLYPGARVLDVGANHGWYSIVACPVIGGTGMLLALEPNPRLFTLLQNSLSINGFSSFATPLQYAASENDEELILDSSLNYSGGGTTRPIQPKLNAKRQQHQVVAVNLDSLCQERFGGYANVIKMDIEGWEGSALRGLTNHLKNAEDLKFLIEWSPQMDNTCFNRKVTAALLNDFGFEPRKINSDGSTQLSTWSDLVDLPVLTTLAVVRQGSQFC